MRRGCSCPRSSTSTPRRASRVTSWSTVSSRLGRRNMAEATMGGSRPSLFLRNATGLVKAWSTFDAFVYSFWSVNLITLGLYGMSYVYWVPNGQLLAAILIFGLLTTFLVVTYSMLVSVMPRTGGDYAWQSRVLGGGLGFVLSITGWWFTLFLWAPIYANILNVQFFLPLAYTLQWAGVATFFTSQTGLFVSCLIRSEEHTSELQSR